MRPILPASDVPRSLFRPTRVVWLALSGFAPPFYRMFDCSDNRKMIQVKNGTQERLPPHGPNATPIVWLA